MPKYSLREARTLVGLSLSQLAEDSRTPISTLADLERGATQNPGFGLVMRVVNALRLAGLRALRPEDVFTIERVQLVEGGAQQADRLPEAAAVEAGGDGESPNAVNE